MDHPKLEGTSNNHNCNNSLTIGSLSTTSFATSQYLDSKQLRLRQLQFNMQQRLQKEIAETDERIQRYTSQQFALLKSFREKSEQEYQMLVSLIHCIPEQQANELLERQPPAFEVCNNSGSLAFGGTRRRNTVSSRRELNNAATTPTTPTALQPPNNLFTPTKDNVVKNSTTATNNSHVSAILTSGTASNPLSSAAASSTSAAPPTIPTVVGSNLALNRKMSNFDTPPATPESLPMSVGNSPTFRQQQQQPASFSNVKQNFQQQFPTPTVDTADDCLFDLEGDDGINIVASPNTTMYLQNPLSPLRPSQPHQMQPQNVPHQVLPPYNSYQRSLTYNTHTDNHMSDLDESDDAEEAEGMLTNSQ